MLAFILIRHHLSISLNGSTYDIWLNVAGRGASSASPVLVHCSYETLCPGVQKVRIGQSGGIGQFIFCWENIDLYVVQSVGHVDQFFLWVGRFIYVSRFSIHVVILYQTNYILLKKFRFKATLIFIIFSNIQIICLSYPMFWPYCLWFQVQ